MHPIKEDVDARLPLERATNVFWVTYTVRGRVYFTFCSVGARP